MYKILDLFSGAGGFSYGFEMNKNFKSVLATDFNDEALKTYMLNHKESKVMLGDITDENHKNKLVKAAKDLGVNMVIGGPPCQGFSLKGKKLGLKDKRNFLFLEFVDVVKKVKPDFFVLENVKSMISAAGGFFVKEAIKRFEEIGYNVSASVLKASDFGVPQKRERAFIIGSSKIDISLPKAKNRKIITIKDAIYDLNFLDSGEHSKKYNTEPLSSFQRKMRRGSKYLQFHKATNHSKSAIKRMSMIPEKGNKFDLPKNLRTNQKFNTTWSRLHWDKPSPTIDTRFDTPSNGQNIHPVLNRAITPREAARIQSFPDNFHFLGKKTQVCKQIGNAVPPLLAKAIADHIIKKQEEGDVFQIKNLKIINGNSYNINPLNFCEFDAIITDPPYNISKKNNFNTMKKKRKGIDFGDWDKGFDLTSWIPKYFKNLKKGGSIIIFCSFLFVSDICRKIEECGGKIKDLIKWTKTNPMPRNIERRYVNDTEFAIWAVKPGGSWTFNKGDAKYRRAHYSSATVLGKERTNHPTQKSLKVMEEIIKTHTNKGDLIIDPFLGSGTTGVAAKNKNRKFIGIEISKEYFEISKKRLISPK